MLIGYARVSKADGSQSLDLQHDALRAAGVERDNIYDDLASGGSVAKIVKLEHAWRRLDGRNDDGFQVAPFPG
ncbi:recombinase family protein [Pseudomonas aeruginosa]|uniref:recombinase family protein n=1 Tax=Pseudomonas aeruginosa TaxID=287 RepID=UPI0009470256